MISIEIAYAGLTKQALLKISVAEETTVLEAIQQSKILELFPEIKSLEGNIGIFGKTVSPNKIVQKNDRIEIYRSLYLDPKEARRGRAKINKKLNKL